MCTDLCIIYSAFAHNNQDTGGSRGGGGRGEEGREVKQLRGNITVICILYAFTVFCYYFFALVKIVQSVNRFYIERPTILLKKEAKV